MGAVWYEHQGGAADVLRYGGLPDPQPGPGEVVVRIRLSGVNPGDTKKRRGWLGSSMPFPRVIPHSDGSGVIEAVGARVDPTRVGTVRRGADVRSVPTAVADDVVALDAADPAAAGDLVVACGEPIPLDRAASAHDRVDAGCRERVLLEVPQ